MTSQSYALRGRPSRACIPRSVASAAPTSPSCTPYGRRRCSRAPEIHRRAAATAPPLTIERNSRGRSACTSGRRCRARAPGSATATAATSPSCTPNGAIAACPWDPMPQPLPPRRRARLRGPSPCTGLRDPPPRACPPDPPSRACPPDPPSRACSQVPPPRAPLRGGGVTVGVAKTEP
jgi:hypothetical protein